VHPILAVRQRLALYIGFWFHIAILLTAVYSTVGDIEGITALILVVPLSIAYSFVCLSAWYVCRATPLKVTGMEHIFITHIGSAVFSAAIWVVAWEIWAQILAGFPAFEQSVDDYRSRLPLIFATGMVLFWLASMFHYLLIAFETSRQAETRELGLEDLAREAELKALRAQIDSSRFVRIHRPHILNIERLARIELYAKDSHEAILHDGTKLAVSRSGHARLIALI